MSNLVVRTNVLAMNSHRHLGNVARQQMQASARLSSGFRINSAADDAAGLGVSENMRAQITGLQQARRNALDGISLIQTAESGLDTITDMLRRIRELTVQAANDTYTNETDLNALGQLLRTDSNRSRIQAEIDNLIAEIGRQGQTIDFNGRRLLDGSDFRTAASGSGTYWDAYQAAIDDLADERYTLEGYRRILQEARDEFNTLAANGWYDATNTYIGETNFITNTLQLAIDDFEAQRVTVELAFEELMDARRELEEAMRENGINHNLWFQVGPNSTQGTSVSMPDINHLVFRQLEQLFFSQSIDPETFSVGNVELGAVSNGTHQEITAKINNVDAMISTIVGARSQLGAVQNRLEFTIDNLAIAAENLTEANSRIRDTDMAEEMMRLTQANILQQAATAMLAQANQAPQSILQLLG